MEPQPHRAAQFPAPFIGRGREARAGAPRDHVPAGQHAAGRGHQQAGVTHRQNCGGGGGYTGGARPSTNCSSGPVGGRGCGGCTLGNWG
eukprot:gene12743-biopygen19973